MTNALLQQSHRLATEASMDARALIAEGWGRT